MRQKVSFTSVQRASSKRTMPMPIAACSNTDRKRASLERRARSAR
jgi:hypothetical protein